MGIKIFVKPADTWGFFTKNRERLAKEQVELASNTDTATSIYITEEYGLPLFTIYRKDERIGREPAVRLDCEETMRNLCFKHLFPLVVNDNGKKDNPKKTVQHTAGDIDDLDYGVHDNTDYVTCGGGVCLKTAGKSGPQDLEDEIYIRDDELEQAVGDALAVFVGCDDPADYGFEAEEVRRLVDEVCEYLAENYAISVYRPMWVSSEQDDQTQEYKEFPYDALIDYGYDLETNPDDPIEQ